MSSVTPYIGALPEAPMRNCYRSVHSMQAFAVFYCTTSVRPACIKRRSKSSLGLPTTSCRPVPSSCRNRAPVDAITTQPNPTRFAVPPFLIQEEAMSVLSAVHAVCDARYVAFVIESRLSLTETQEAFPILYIPVRTPHICRGSPADRSSS